MEEFKAITMFPVVAYHGSLKEEWGLYYVSRSSRSNRLLTLKPLGAAVVASGGRVLDQVSQSSISGTGKFVNPDTGEIW
jgi:hypothetical protein